MGTVRRGCDAPAAIKGNEMAVKKDFKLQRDGLRAQHARFLRELDRYVENNEAGKAVLTVFGILDVEERYDDMWYRWERVLGKSQKLNKLVRIIPKYAKL